MSSLECCHGLRAHHDLRGVLGRGHDALAHELRRVLLHQVARAALILQLLVRLVPGPAGVWVDSAAWRVTIRREVSNGICLVTTAGSTCREVLSLDVLVITQGKALMWMQPRRG